MGEFYISTTYSRMLGLLRKLGLEIRQSGNHVKAINPRTRRWTMVPRHKTLKKGTVESICGFLVEEGYDTKPIKKALQ
jgi:predicted RNA binding protein YcfA (HicA-like mRNA interferase family)